MRRRTPHTVAMEVAAAESEKVLQHLRRREDRDGQASETQKRGRPRSVAPHPWWTT